MPNLKELEQLAKRANDLRLIANEATRKVWLLKDKIQLEIIRDYANSCIKELEK